MRFAALLGLLGCLSGCFVLSDTGRFEQDVDCDLELRLRDFGPHTDDTFEIRLVRPFGPGEDGVIPPPTLVAAAVFEPLEATTLNLRMPNAVPANTDPRRPPHRIDYFGDDDSSEARGTVGYNFPGDHSWMEANACVEGPSVFIHDTFFDELPAPDELHAPMIVRVCPDVTIEGTLEVRVTGTEVPVEDALGPEQTRAVGLLRYSERDPDRPPTLPGVIDDDFDHRIEIYDDRNENGTFDTGEPAWEFRIEGGELVECDLRAEFPDIDRIVPLPNLNNAMVACGDLRLPDMLLDRIGFDESPPCEGLIDAGTPEEKDVIFVTIGRISTSNETDSITNLFEDGSANSWLNFLASDTGETDL
ncbi:MAG: hypothetical protein AAGE52_37465 [Myxococcota bacterium]